MVRSNPVSADVNLDQKIEADGGAAYQHVMEFNQRHNARTFAQPQPQTLLLYELLRLHYDLCTSGFRVLVTMRTCLTVHLDLNVNGHYIGRCLEEALVAASWNCFS